MPKRAKNLMELLCSQGYRLGKKIPLFGKKGNIGIKLEADKHGCNSNN